jgi:hypothetical protein
MERIPPFVVARWRRWKARENYLIGCERELARNPNNQALKAAIEREKRNRGRNHLPAEFSSWAELETRLRAAGQI